MGLAAAAAAATEMLTREQLHEYASEQDGCCKVLIKRRAIELHPPDEELGYEFYWDYYFTDEAESFDFGRFGL